MRSRPMMRRESNLIGIDGFGIGDKTGNGSLYPLQTLQPFAGGSASSHDPDPIVIQQSVEDGTVTTLGCVCPPGVGYSFGTASTDRHQIERFQSSS